MEGNTMVPDQQPMSNKRTRNGSNKRTKNDSNKRTINDAEGGTLQNPPIDTQHAPEEQPTSQGSHGRVRTIRIKYNGSQESTSTRVINDVLDTFQENPSFNVEPDDHPILSKLHPPSKSDQFKTEEAFLKLLQQASSVLSEEVEKAQDANRMVDLASKTFDLLDSLGVDYLALYEGVHSFIRQQCDKEALHEQKPHPAFITKAEHEQIMSGFSNGKERKSGVDRKVKDARDVVTSDMSKVTRSEGKLKKRKETLVKNKEILDAVLAEQVDCDKVFYESELKAKNIAPKMGEAQLLIDNWERRWNETNNRLNRAKDELSRFKM